MKKVVFITVHPDDETLSMGGTILKHKATGDQIYWLILTNISVENGWGERVVVKRQKEIQEVCKRYKFNKSFNLNLPTAKLDTIPMEDIIQKISRVFIKIQPNIIYLPNRSDVHTDHQVAFQSAFSCTKNFRYPSVEAIYMGETLSETEFAPSLAEYSFIPNYFVDISDYMGEKLSIMKLYDSEVMEGSLPRSLNSIQALNRYRGSRINVPFAEAFQCLFKMW